MLSDPVATAVAAGANLSVGVHVAGSSVTGHMLAVQTSYVSGAGDHAAEEAGTAYRSSITHWYRLDAVVVDVRHSGELDAVRRPGGRDARPAAAHRLLPGYDSGDHPHPSNAGHRAIADAVDLRTLECTR